MPISGAEIAMKTYAWKIDSVVAAYVTVSESDSASDAFMDLRNTDQQAADLLCSLDVCGNPSITAGGSDLGVTVEWVEK